jgi:protein-tyrosine phosphatase
MSAIVDKRPPGSPKIASPKQAPKSPPKPPKSPPKRGKSPPGSPGKLKGAEKAKRRGRREGKKKEKEKVVEDEAVKSSFDCSSAIANVAENLWVSAVSGTKMGASLEATLLDNGMTAVVSTVDKPVQNENFTQLDVDTTREECAPNLHEACDFISEQIECGGSVFVHSRSGFARSEWAVLIVLGYLVKYENMPLLKAVELLTEKTKRQISPATKWRRELRDFEDEALGETSVDDDWVENEGADEVSHALSRQKLADNMNDRRLLKKKSPHK